MNGESSRRKAAFWVSAVFLLGAALGAIVAYGYAHRSFASTAAPRTDQAKRAQKVEELTKLLALTNAQQQKLDKVLTEIQGQMKEIRRQSEPQMDVVRQKGRAEIRSFLAPEQMPKFEEFIRKLDEQRKKELQ
jgi:Spy/CpxP family protein refolding chaperone